MILVNGNVIQFSDENVNSIQEIPAGNWLLMVDPKGTYYLEKMDEFVMPEKVYGNVGKLAERFINTFSNIDKNLGIILNGLKGTGKSLTAKEICIKSKLPVIVVNNGAAGTDFNKFVCDIKQECILFMDEFEKQYKSKEHQEALLSLLDGAFMGKKMFLFTSNSTGKLSSYMQNRPGRIHYMKDYERLEDDVIYDVMKDLLDNKDYAEELYEVISNIDEANMDMLMALIRECNMYEENPLTAIKLLNIKSNGGQYRIKHTDKNGDEYVSDCEFIENANFSRIPAYLYMTNDCQARHKKAGHEKYKDYLIDISRSISLMPNVLKLNKSVEIEQGEDRFTFIPEKIFQKEEKKEAKKDLAYPTVHLKRILESIKKQ